MSKEVLEKGLDVSSHQGNVNWQKVKAAGYSFVMIRVGYRGYKTGKIVLDPKFKKNIEGALAAGLKVGVYFYDTSVNEAEAKESAYFVIDMIKAYKVELPAVYDFEGYKEAKYRTYGITKAQRTANCKAFNGVMNDAGYSTVLYGSQGNIRTTYNLDVLTDPLWIAKYAGGYKCILDDDKYYPNVGAYTDRVAMWQYTSIGKVNGISGNVDLDNMYVDLSKMQSAPTDTIKAVNPYAFPKKVVKYNKLTVLIVKEDVKWLQWELVQAGYNIMIDGRFGKKTLAALKDYQFKHDLETDGKCGPITKESLLAA